MLTSLKTATEKMNEAKKILNRYELYVKASQKYNEELSIRQSLVHINRSLLVRLSDPTNKYKPPKTLTSMSLLEAREIVNSINKSPKHKRFQKNQHYTSLCTNLPKTYDKPKNPTFPKKLPSIVLKKPKIAEKSAKSSIQSLQQTIKNTHRLKSSCENPYLIEQSPPINTRIKLKRILNKSARSSLGMLEINQFLKKTPIESI